MSILNNSLLLSPPAEPPRQISRSLRFNAADSAYLSRTPSVSGNRKTWTFSAWVKRSAIGTDQHLIHAGPGQTSDANYLRIYFSGSDDRLRVSNFFNHLRVTAQVFRDLAAWFHLVVAVDTNQVTADNRIRVYVNGLEVTAFSSLSNPTQNADTGMNAAIRHDIGVGDGGYFSGYLAECYLIDGQQLTPNSFGLFDANGEWQPRTYTGTYGTNGFKLDFADNSAATAATLGKDTSGNGNNYTPYNFSVRTKLAAYSTNYTVNWPGYSNTYFGDGWTRGFNADLNDGVFVYNNGETTLTLPPGTTWSYRIRIRLYWYGGIIAVNGTTLTGSFTSTPTWYDFTSQLGSSGTLSTIRITSVSSNYTALAAVELDDVVLYDAGTDTSDSLVDTPTSYGVDTGLGNQVRGNYCTWNPLRTNLWTASNAFTLADGNLRVNNGSSGYGVVSGSMAMTSGKYYWEISFVGTVSGSWDSLGIVAIDANSATPWPGNFDGLFGYLGNGNKISNTNGYFGSSYGASYAGTDIIGVAFDADNGTLTFYKNGVSQGVAFTGINSARGWSPYVGDYSNAVTVTSWIANFGQRPFVYPAPSGFKTLCDTNLPTPVIARPSTVFDTRLYTGNGSSQNITGLGFSPDFVWIKARSQPYSNTVFDAIRGATNYLYTDTTGAEATNAQFLTAFNSDGFSLGTNAAVNQSSTTYVAWTWDAGSSTVTNTQGSITSSVRANASAGFSIVTVNSVTGSASATIGHGLGVTPAMYIQKARNTTYSWNTYFNNNGTWIYLTLNGTGAASATTTANMGTTPTSTTVGIGSNFVGSYDYVYYCFAPVAGYSSFGSYTGNGSADGPFVYTGMRPRYLCIKSTSFSDQWIVFDSARNTSNVVNLHLHPNLSNNESSLDWLDFTSNGFKIRTTYSTVNQSSGSFIYFAFAENPFQYARAR